MGQPAQKHGENPKKEIHQPETYESENIDIFQEQFETDQTVVFMRSPFIHLLRERTNQSKAEDGKYLAQKSGQG